MPTQNGASISCSLACSSDAMSSSVTAVDSRIIPWYVEPVSAAHSARRSSSVYCIESLEALVGITASHGSTHDSPRSRSTTGAEGCCSVFTIGASCQGGNQVLFRNRFGGI